MVLGSLGVIKSSATLTVFATLCCMSFIGTPTSVFAQGIEQLLIENIPVPQQRPQDVSKPAQNQGQAKTSTTDLNVASGEQKVAAIKGSLKQGLNALDKGDVSTALAIRSGLAAGSLDRKILAWAIALSGKPGIKSGTIAKIASDLSSWPGQTAMRKNMEKAIAREGVAPTKVISIFGNSKPESVEGAIALASAHLKNGQRNAANKTIAPFWRNEKLSRKTEKQILDRVGSALSRKDHRVRMHQLLYVDRATAALRVAGRAEQTSLGKARAAVLRKSPKAGSLLKAVAPSSKKDTGYLFARIEHARRTEQYSKAAELLQKAPSNPDLLVNPGEWWVERRIVSRQMVELGKYKLAYRLVANHAAKSSADIAEAEFHAGWYALRFLKDKGTARRHFARILDVATRPISKARGLYWLARASSSAKSRDLLRQAAKYDGTYYGQIAAAELGRKQISISKSKPGSTDRSRLKGRELNKAIKRLEAIGRNGWRADIIYRHFARTLSSPKELAILAADAERQGKFSLSLQIGKIAFRRGLEVDTLAWPVGAIPASANISNTGRALAYAIARQESALNKAAVSPANARGLLQLLPGTAKGVARRNGYKYSRKNLTRDAGYNATLGAAYLSEQLDRYDNSYILTFAAYNAGPGRVDEWLERFGDPRGKPLYQVIDWVEQIPFTETRHYVQRVMENYQVYKKRISNSSLAIRSDLIKGRR